MSQQYEQELDRLFAACRVSSDDETEAVVSSEAYLSGVWDKIEAARPRPVEALTAEQQLDQVFARARTAYDAAEPEVSPAFLPALWRKIEAARPLSLEQQLDQLFVRARAAFGQEPEPSANYMPELWRKIEDARPLDGWLEWVRSWAPRLAGAGALAACLLIGAVWTRPSVDAVALEGGYVDHLTEQSMDEHDAALWTSAGLRR